MYVKETHQFLSSMKKHAHKRNLILFSASRCTSHTKHAPHSGNTPRGNCGQGRRFSSLHCRWSRSALWEDYTRCSEVQISCQHKHRRIRRHHVPHNSINKNSSGDEIANVNFCTTTTYLRPLNRLDNFYFLQ